MSAEAIRSLVEPALVSAGLELWDVEIQRDVVRVLVDRPGGVDLDSLATVAGKVVSPLLDEHSELTPAGSYQLEVSSPGLERNLTRPEHFERYLGQEVSVKTAVAVEGARRHQGALLSHDAQALIIRTESCPSLRLPLDQVERARTVLVWGPTPKKGAAKRPAAPGRRAVTTPVALHDNDKDSSR